MRIVRNGFRLEPIEIVVGVGNRAAAERLPGPAPPEAAALTMNFGAFSTASSLTRTGANRCDTQIFGQVPAVKGHDLSKIESRNHTCVRCVAILDHNAIRIRRALRLS